MTSAPSTVTLRIRIDTAPLRRAFHDAGQGFTTAAAVFTGRPPVPRRPYPREISPLTARQYRAARRRYGRELRAWRRAVKAGA